MLKRISTFFSLIAAVNTFEDTKRRNKSKRKTEIKKVNCFKDTQKVKIKAEERNRERN
jgi:hypothetical protein